MSMEDKVYTNEDIEREVQERVAFKLNDIKDAINNNIRRCKHSQYHGITELNKGKLSEVMPSFLVMSNYRIGEESWTVLNELFKKETEMPVPYDEMYIRKKGIQKNEAVDEVMDRFDRMTRGMRIHPNQRHQFIKMLVNNIEKLQRG
jgi:hypothetical protein